MSSGIPAEDIWFGKKRNLSEIINDDKLGTSRSDFFIYIIKLNIIKNQCCGSVTFLYGYGSGSADPYH
jgi:hypothetical protein